MSDRHLPTSTSTLRVDIRGAEIWNEDESGEASDIYLPKHTEFISHIALDIGGSLAKVVYFTRAAQADSQQKNRSRSSKPSHEILRKPHSESESQNPHQTEELSGDRFSPTATSSNSNCSSDLEPHKFSNSGPHSSARSSISQPNGILNPTVVREKILKKDLDRDDGSRYDEQEADRRGNSRVTPTNKSPNRRFKKKSSRQSSISSIPGGRLNFIKFETDCIESECIPFISNLIEISAQSNGVPISTMKRGVKIIITGGGAYMYADLIKDALGGDVEVLKEDEMDCLITGLNFITEIPNEVFWFSDELVQEIIHNNHPTNAQSGEASKTRRKTGENDDLPPPSSSSSSSSTSALEIEGLPRPSPNPPQYSVSFDPDPTPQFPCMLVNIGSGVSLIKVTGFGEFERISGTSLGGGTLWGLLSLLTNAKSFDEMLDLSMKGDNSKVDMLVGDIYGQDYGKIGLKSSTIASSFGKVFKKSSPKTSHQDGDQISPKVEFKAEDISKSLLYAISNNIGQIAHLNAEKHKLDRIYFGGCFIRGHVATVSTLSYAIRFWSKGKRKAFFLRHEGYLGSIGAWLKNIDQEIHPDSPS